MSIQRPFSFTQFVESGIRSLYAATSRAAFDTAFEDFIADDARITLNGTAVSRAQYQEHLFRELVPHKATRVDFKGAVESFEHKDPSQPILTAGVGVFFDTHAGVEHPTYKASLNVSVYRREVNAEIRPPLYDTKVTVLNDVSQGFPARVVNHQA